MKRSAKAIWSGTLIKGEGNLTTQMDILNKTPYSADNTGLPLWG